MIIRAIKFRVATNSGDYGFYFTFSRQLTIIRGSNSSGKSTLFNCMLYGLGMEELIGGRGAEVLPYAVKDHFEYDSQRIEIIASEVYVEIENDAGDIVTLRRSIRDEVRDTKLVDIVKGKHLTSAVEFSNVKSTYLHDSGSAKKEGGFHYFLEEFLGLNLPQVATTNGGMAKLYLQSVFAAMAIEQKRGWTDYIANTPFYRIRDARRCVTEYILGLGVFETNALRIRLNMDSLDIANDWRRVSEDLRRVASESGVIVDGLQSTPSALFNAEHIRLNKPVDNQLVSITTYISNLMTEHTTLEKRAQEYNKTKGADTLKELDLENDEIHYLSVLHERSTVSLSLQRASLLEYEALLNEVKEDLERNKTAAKLRELGVQHAPKLAAEQCPTCDQHVEDTLLIGMVSGPQMDLQENIDYLNSQRRMLQNQIAGVRESIEQSSVKVKELSTKVADKHDYISALRGDVSSGASESRAITLRQVKIEIEISKVEKLEAQTNQFIGDLKSVISRLIGNQSDRRELPKENYTSSDLACISIFEKMFRANAGSFGYESAPISEIKISHDNLTPSLSQIELREIIRKPEKTNIKADSSASDFVRLIWSYSLALYQASIHPSTKKGNHLGLLLFDEPGQHSMRSISQHALLKMLSSESNLQSIVAASFDENESVFKEATHGLKYKLIGWDGKLIKPL